MGNGMENVGQIIEIDFKFSLFEPESLARYI